ncbi:MAG: ArsR family transcriptional regulator [Ramlibacter sp.]|nr:ArsR family transcriptional regulator [Ramlibacter sp.]
MNFAEFETEDRRLVILRGLESATQYRANAFLIRRYCDAVAHVVSSDRIEQDLAWLAEQGLVTVERPEGVTVATLTARGQDVAAGRARVPGVARPQPGA